MHGIKKGLVVLWLLTCEPPHNYCQQNDDYEEIETLLTNFSMVLNNRGYLTKRFLGASEIVENIEVQNGE